MHPADSLDLADRAALGDTKAKEELIFLFLDWVRVRAQSYQEEFPQVDVERLVRSGIEGLLMAIADHDPGLFFSFKGFAFQYIFVAMDKELQEQAGIGTTLTLGRQKAQEFIAEARSLVRRGGIPHQEDVRLELGWSYQQLNERLSAMKRRPSPRRGRKSSPAGLPGLIEAAGHYRKASSDELLSWKEALSGVGQQGRQVLELRHGLTGHPPMTLRAIGSRFRLSYERIRLIEERALDQYRRRVCQAGLLDRFWVESS